MPAIFTKKVIIKPDFPLGEHDVIVNDVNAYLTKDKKPVMVLSLSNDTNQQDAIFNSSNPETRGEFKAEDFAKFVLKPLSRQLQLGNVDADTILTSAIGKTIKVVVSETLVTDQVTGEVTPYINLRIK